MTPIESIGPDDRSRAFRPPDPPPGPGWRHWLAVVLVAAVAGGLAARFTPRPEPLPMLLADPATGPLRPRPIPPKPVPPEPEAKDDSEARLFARIKVWVEQRADARADARVESSLREITDAMDLAQTDPDSKKLQGTLGNVFVAKLTQFVRWIIDKVIQGIVIAALLAIAWKFWPYLAAAGGVLVTVSGWFGWLGGKSAKG